MATIVDLSGKVFNLSRATLPAPLSTVVSAVSVAALFLMFTPVCYFQARREVRYQRELGDLERHLGNKTIAADSFSNAANSYFFPYEKKNKSI